MTDTAAIERAPRGDLERLQAERLRRTVTWAIERVPRLRERFGG